MTRKEWLMLLSLASLNFTNIVDFMIMMPLGPQLIRLFDISNAEFGLLVSSYTLSAGISGIGAAFYVDRFDRKKLLLFLYSGFLLGTIACGLVTGFWPLLLARIFTGLFGGVMGAVVLSFVGDVIPFERRAQAMGIIMGAFSLASVFGVPFGIYLSSHAPWGWHSPFLFLGVTGIPVWFVLWQQLPNVVAHLNRPKSEKNQLSVIWGLVRNSNRAKAIVMMVMLMYGHFALIPYLSPFMEANNGFADDDLPLIYFFGGIATIISSPLIGKLADRKGKRVVYSWFVMLCCLPILALTLLYHSPMWLTLTVTTCFFMFSGGRFIPAQAMITATVDPAHRGSFLSITSSLQQFAAGITSAISGLIIHTDGVAIINGLNQVHVNVKTEATMHFYWVVGIISIVFTLLTIPLSVKIRSNTGDSF